MGRLRQPEAKSVVGRHISCVSGHRREGPESAESHPVADSGTDCRVWGFRNLIQDPLTVEILNLPPAPQPCPRSDWKVLEDKVVRLCTV